MTPWTPCECCGEYLCNIHQMHAHECECPPVDEWDHSPYEEIMNRAIIDHVEQLVNSISKPLRKYEFVIGHKGERIELRQRGEDMEDAKRAISFYYPGDLTIYECKDITDEK